MNWNSQAVESVATACAAVFTAVMAGMTWRAIADNRKHHKDEYRPILVLVVHDGVDPAHRHALLRAHGLTPSAGPCYSLAGVVLRNIGCGPALNCRLTIRFHDIEGYGVTRDLSPVQAGGEYGTGECPLRIPVSFGRGFESPDFQSGLGSEWKILLEYQDLFGQVFHTVHTSDLRDEWTEIGTGPIPQGESPHSRARRLSQSSSASPPATGGPFGS